MPAYRTRGSAGPASPIALAGAQGAQALHERGAAHGRRVEGHRPTPPTGPGGGHELLYRKEGFEPPIVLAPRTAPSSYTAPPGPADPARSQGTVEPAPRGAFPAPGVPAGTGAVDLPHLVDRVVREIDRRVVARRERRGWSRWA
ncbi:MAG TPA: hypothetical protein VLH10_09990 [Yinghuangia sp.]|nr:hypothetical protein [Yinghuangia sp.]